MKKIKNTKVYILKHSYSNGFYLFSDQKQLLGIYDNIKQYLEIENNQIIKLNSLEYMKENVMTYENITDKDITIQMRFNAVLLEE